MDIKRKDLMVASRIKSYRIYRGLTQEQLAAMIGVERTTVVGYETGHRLPDLPMCARIAKALNTSLDNLAGMDVIKKTSKYHPMRRKEDNIRVSGAVNGGEGENNQ